MKKEKAFYMDIAFLKFSNVDSFVACGTGAAVFLPATEAPYSTLFSPSRNLETPSFASPTTAGSSRSGRVGQAQSQSFYKGFCKMQHCTLPFTTHYCSFIKKGTM